VGRLRRTAASGTGLPGRAGVDVDTTVVGCAARASGAGSRPAPTHDAAPGAAAAVTSGRHAALGPASGLTRRTSVGRHG
jgi:hypothetical protein